MILMNEKDIVITLSDGTKMRSYYAHPDDGRKHPAILVVHEIWGLESSIRAIAKKFAGQGYVVLSPDLYHRDSLVLNPKNIEETMMKFFSLPPEKRRDEASVQEFMKDLDEEKKKVMEKIFFSRENLEKGMVSDLIECKKFLENDPNVKDGSIGATGFCLGGGIVFQLATRSDVKATVVFYGSNPHPVENVKDIKGEVLGLYAGEDTGINNTLPDLLREFVKNKKSYSLKIYEGAVHAFFNHERPTYNKEVAEDAWESATGFFSKHLGE